LDKQKEVFIMLKFIAALSLLVVVSADHLEAPLHLGCFKPKESKLIFSDRQTHSEESFFSGIMVDWVKFDEYLLSAACRCERAAAEEGFKFFSLREFGECHGIGKGKKKFSELGLVQSDVCIAHNLQQCNSEKICTGASDNEIGVGEFVYQADIDIAPKVTNGGYTAWTKWSKCSKSCGSGVQERERACTHPEPSGEGAKDCGVLGKPSELKKCSLRKCAVATKPTDTHHTDVFCEHRGIREIKCANPNQVISVYGANYGRLSTEYCRFGNFRRTNCRSSSSDLKIKTMCNGRNSCRINPHNAVYGDPCWGIVKYVSIKYKCSYKDPTLHERCFCEHRGAKTISCAGNKKISVVGANYGRLSTQYCRFGNFRRTNCRAPRSDGQIKRLCNGKNSCKINPHNAVYGDPCWGVVKYVSIRFQCHN